MLRAYASNGIGYAISVHSYNLDWNDGIFGPYFDDATLATYQSAENDSP
jgi:hypothetical protein